MAQFSPKLWHYLCAVCNNGQYGLKILRTSSIHNGLATVEIKVLPTFKISNPWGIIASGTLTIIGLYVPVWITTKTIKSSSSDLKGNFEKANGKDNINDFSSKISVYFSSTFKHLDSCGKLLLENKADEVSLDNQNQYFRDFLLLRIMLELC